MNTVERVSLVVENRRSALGLSADMLANVAGVPVAVITGIESGTPACSIREVRRGLDVIGIEPLALPGDLGKR